MTTNNYVVCHLQSYTFMLEYIIYVKINSLINSLLHHYICAFTTPLTLLQEVNN